ncbi:MAG TPA: TIGR01777 family oxidoreductase [Candidatus Polarisedimenticolaceae bacterium]|nr:TIGR01777 family oxidoreductase [Candidatus Polarisedimenticolaceae bacterium]
MKVVIPGGSGQVGALLTRALAQDGHDVVVLSRGAATNGTRTVTWDAQKPGPWTDEIDGADVVINLAGRSVNCRYNDTNRRAIMQSRVRTTRLVGEAIAGAKRPPRVWLQASTATIYAHRFDAPNDEATGILGGREPDAPDTWRFSIDVARAWERELDSAQVTATRRVKLRSAIVMSPDPGGAFDRFVSLARRGLGGRLGDGRQYVSWIHELDFVRAVSWLIQHDDVEGPVNVASPGALPNAEFMRELRQAAGVRFGLPSAPWMLELGAFAMKTETELILKSRRVAPGLLQERGFKFVFPDWRRAAQDLCRRWEEAGRVVHG